MISLPEIPSAPTIGPRFARAVGFAFAGAFLLWAASYAAGVFPWIGYAWLSRSSIDVGPGHFIIGEDSAGSTYGISTFLFFTGQTIVVSYDADIRRGCLWLQVWHMYHQGLGESVSRCVTASGQGEWSVPVTQTGIYKIIVHSSPIKGVGPGWEMAYTAWWGAR